MIPLDKNELRKRALKARHDLSIEKKTKYDSLFLEYLKEYLNPYQTIGIYVSKEEEVDTHLLIAFLLNQKKNIVIPKTHPDSLTFHQIDTLNDLKKGVFGVLEPNLSEPYPISKIEVMIVPVVAFDHNKNRIGYGKGYYDSFLVEGCNSIGIAYPEQEVNQIPVDTWDIPLDEIITIDKMGSIQRIL